MIMMSFLSLLVKRSALIILRTLLKCEGIELGSSPLQCFVVFEWLVHIIKGGLFMDRPLLLR